MVVVDVVAVDDGVVLKEREVEERERKRRREKRWWEDAMMKWRKSEIVKE